MSFRAELQVLDEERSLESAVRRLISAAEGSKTKTDTCLRRFEVKIPHEELLGILAMSESSEKFYWSDRKRTMEWMGLGIAVKIIGKTSEMHVANENMREILEALGGDAQFFGGMRFDRASDSKDKTWEQFPELCFVLPAVELRSTSTETKVCLNLRSTNEVESACKILESMLSTQNHPGSEEIGKCVHDSRVLDRESWEQKVGQSLALLSESPLEKIVLANAHDFEFENTIDPTEMLEKLSLRSPSTYRFLMQLSEGHAFVGASPEQLFARDELRIESEAQAGTRRRGKNDEEDIALAEELLKSDKEFVEHDLVFKDIESVLSGLCRDSGWMDQRKIIKLSHVQHLRSRFGGILNEGVSDAEVLDALHPTPAVCGRPIELSRMHIRELEEFDRGYYCGPIGMIGLKHTEFAVALRSALINDNKIRLFAGAGLVNGSQAQDEWNEIESKMRLYYEILRN